MQPAKRLEPCIAPKGLAVWTSQELHVQPVNSPEVQGKLRPGPEGRDFRLNGGTELGVEAFRAFESATSVALPVDVEVSRVFESDRAAVDAALDAHLAVAHLDVRVDPLQTS